MNKGKIVLAVLLSCTMAIAISVFGLTGTAHAGEVRISAVDFTTDGQSAPNDYVKDITNGALFGSAAYPCLAAVVKIPSTATHITKMIIYLTDDGNDEISGRVRLIGMKVGVGITITPYADSSLQGDVAPGLETIEIPLQKKKIEKGQNIALEICLSAGQVFYGAKIVYQ